MSDERFPAPTPATTPATTWRLAGDVSDYDARWQAIAASGANAHGEADLIASFGPAAVLDGGCGTGRVAVELDRRGFPVVGVDADPAMLEAARSKAPHLRWVHGDLAEVDLGHSFDLVALPGNVMIFVTPGREGAVVANLARHLAVSGRLIAGFQLTSDRLDLHTYDQLCSEAGLALEHRWSTRGRDPYAHGDYAVSVHLRTGT